MCIRDRVEIFKSDSLLPGADSQAHRSLSQLVHQIYVAELKQTQWTSVGGKAAAVVHHARLLFLDVDQHITAFEAGGGFSGGLGANNYLPESVGEIEFSLAIGYSIRAQHVVFGNRNHT